MKTLLGGEGRSGGLADARGSDDVKHGKAMNVVAKFIFNDDAHIW